MINEKKKKKKTHLTLVELVSTPELFQVGSHQPFMTAFMLCIHADIFVGFALFHNYYAMFSFYDSFYSFPFVIL